MRGMLSTLERADLNDQVYASLKERLATRKLAPGEKLSLQELATAFGISRSPVQNALTRLVSEGLVEVKPHTGHFVKPITVAVVEEAYEVREALELQAARRSVGSTGPEALAEFRRLMEQTLAMLEGRRIVDRRGYIRTNQAFHDHQVGLAGNGLLREIYRRLSVNELMERVLYSAVGSEGDLAHEHTELVEAFETDDLPRAEAAIRIHVETGRVLAREAVERAGGAL